MAGDASGETVAGAGAGAISFAAGLAAAGFFRLRTVGAVDLLVPPKG